MVQVARSPEPISRQVARQEYAAGALCSAQLGSSRCGSTEPCVIVERQTGTAAAAAAAAARFAGGFGGGKHPDKMG